MRMIYPWQKQGPGLWLQLRGSSYVMILHKATWYLVPLVQKVVLKIVLLKFFPQEEQLEGDAAIATVAECIKSTLDRTPNEQRCC